MAYEPKPNTGSIFKNTFKKEGDKQPNLKGDLFLDKEFLLDQIKASEGNLVKVQVSAWTNESEKAGKYLYLNVGAPFVKREEEIPF
jgi:hypothetical protein